MVFQGQRNLEGNKCELRGGGTDEKPCRGENRLEVCWVPARIIRKSAESDVPVVHSRRGAKKLLRAPLLMVG